MSNICLAARLCALTCAAMAAAHGAWAQTLEGDPVPAPEPRIAAEQRLTARLRDHSRRIALAVPDVAPQAAAVLPYAALANFVYCDAVYERQRASGAALPDDAGCGRDEDLRRFGWAPLHFYPDSAMPMPGGSRGLRLAVFYRDDGPLQPVTIGVAFRGTDFSSWSDWHSNLRWFLPGRDQYDVVAELAPQVIARSKIEVARQLHRDVSSWRIVATGHSLGGGLAQLFAYKSTDVHGVVAFDPSPVTGYHSCVTDDEVNCNVPIWRVYERGEVLSYLRAFTRLFYPLSENIHELEFDLVGGHLIANHSMPRFFTQLAAEVKRHGADGTQVALFEPRPDCTCVRKRRPTLWQDWKQACDDLLAARAAQVSWVDAGSLLP